MAGIAAVQTCLNILFSQSAAGAGNNDYTVTRPGFVADAWNLPRASQVGGTVQLFHGVGGVFNAISDAMNAGVQSALTHAGILVEDRILFATGDVLRFTTVGAGTWLSLCMVVYIPTPAAAQQTV